MAGTGAARGGRPRKTPPGSVSVHLVIAAPVRDGYAALAHEQQGRALGAVAITAQDVMRDVLEKVLRAHQAGGQMRDLLDQVLFADQAEPAPRRSQRSRRTSKAR